MKERAMGGIPCWFVTTNSAVIISTHSTAGILCSNNGHRCGFPLTDEFDSVLMKPALFKTKCIPSR